MRDDERRAATHQIAQPLLNKRFRFRIKARSSFVEDENPWIGKNGPGNRDPLLLAAGKLHAPLANDGVVLFLERFRKLVDSSDTASSKHFFLGGFRTPESDVLAYRSVEEKCLLQHHAQLGAVGIQSHFCEIDPVHQHSAARGSIERRDETDHRGFPRARRSDQCGHVARLGLKADLLENRFAGVIGKTHILKRNATLDAIHNDRAARRFIFRLFAQDFARAFETCERLSDLRANRHDLKNRRHQQTKEDRVREKRAGRYGPRDYLVAA